MAYVPGYAADIFVSYSHSNDRDGWVTELKSKLASGLADLSEDVEVWFDADRLQTGDRFKQEIQEKLSNTRVLIAVLSPAYLKSQFCMDEELDWFQNSFGREIIQYLGPACISFHGWLLSSTQRPRQAESRVTS